MLFEKRLKVGLIDLHIFRSEFTFCNCELSTDPERLLLTLHRKDGFILSHSFFSLDEGSTFTPDSLVKILYKIVFLHLRGLVTHVSGPILESTTGPMFFSLDELSENLNLL